MDKYFDVIFLEQALEFLEKLDLKTRQKIYYNVDKPNSDSTRNCSKKLTDEIWDFRTKYSGQQYRLFAFWDKTDKSETLVISTHGTVKKVDKVPKTEIEKAERIRKEYLSYRQADFKQ